MKEGCRVKELKPETTFTILNEVVNYSLCISLTDELLSLYTILTEAVFL